MLVYTYILDTDTYVYMLINHQMPSMDQIGKIGWIKSISFICLYLFIEKEKSFIA